MLTLENWFLSQEHDGCLKENDVNDGLMGMESDSIKIEENLNENLID
jgi:hypothetical protein